MTTLKVGDRVRHKGDATRQSEARISKVDDDGSILARFGFFTMRYHAAELELVEPAPDKPSPGPAMVKMPPSPTSYDDIRSQLRLEGPVMVPSPGPVGFVCEDFHAMVYRPITTADIPSGTVTITLEPVFYFPTPMEELQAKEWGQAMYWRLAGERNGMRTRGDLLQEESRG